jgi:hypothetical protein
MQVAPLGIPRPLMVTTTYISRIQLKKAETYFGHTMVAHMLFSSELSTQVIAQTALCLDYQAHNLVLVNYNIDTVRALITVTLR